MSVANNDHANAFGSTVLFDVPAEKMDVFADFTERHDIAVFYDSDTNLWNAEAAANDLNSQSFQQLFSEFGFKGEPEVQISDRAKQFISELAETSVREGYAEIYIAPKDRYVFERESFSLGLKPDINTSTDHYQLTASEVSSDAFSSLVDKYKMPDMEIFKPLSDSHTLSDHLISDGVDVNVLDVSQKGVLIDENDLSAFSIKKDSSGRSSFSMDDDILDVVEAVANVGTKAEIAAAREKAQENFSEVKADVRVSFHMDDETPAKYNSRRETSYASKQTIRREGPQAAAVEAAKDSGREFVAIYGRYGFHMAKDKSSETYASQAAHLKAAPADEIRDVINVSAGRYRALLEKENSMRLIHASQHDPHWKSRYQNEVAVHVGDESKSRESYDKLLGEFSQLPFDKMRSLASIGREDAGPIALTYEDKGKMLALGRGFDAMRESYKEKTGNDIGSGIVDLSARQPNAVSLVDTKVKVSAEEDLAKRRERIAARGRRSTGVER